MNKPHQAPKEIKAHAAKLCGSIEDKIATLLLFHPLWMRASNLNKKKVR